MHPAARHPLSPNPESPSAPTSSIGVPASLFDSPSLPSSASSPLFPASPPPDETDSFLSSSTSADERSPRRPSNTSRRRASALTIPAPSSVSRGASTGMSRAGSTTSVSTSASAHDDAAEPLPTHLTFPAAPHLLPSEALAALPHQQLLALVVALSRDNERSTIELEKQHRELEALEEVCKEGGVGRGELERARVRARVGVGDVNEGVRKKSEWRIELAPEQSPKVGLGVNGTSVEEDEGELPSVSEIVLNLDDLAEAMTEDAFVFSAPSPVPSQTDTDDERSSIRAPLSDDDAASVSRLSLASSSALPDSPIDTSHKTAATASGKSAGNRQRHASLSARIFGTFALSPPPAGASSPAPSEASSLHLPPSVATSPPAKTKKRHGRSDSLRSVNSVASATSSIASTSTADRTDAAGGWGGWTSWARGSTKNKASSKAGLSVSSTAEEDNEEIEESGATSSAEADANEAEDSTKPSEPAATTVDDLSTPVPNSSLGFFGLSQVTPTRSRGASDASTSTGTSRHRRDTTITTTNSGGGSPPSSSSVLSGNTSHTSASEGVATSPPAALGSDASKPPHRPADSPILPRPRLPSAPLLSHQQATASPPTSLSSHPPTTPTRRHRKSSSATTASAYAAASLVHDAHADTPALTAADAEVDPERTIKARRKSSGQANGTASIQLKPATPLYSAPGPPSAHSSSKGYVSNARDAVGRALGMGAPSTSPAMSRSQSDGGVRRTSGGAVLEPNLTMFPKLSSLSKYSPFAQPALSTPSTVVSLSSHSLGIPAAASSSSASSYGGAGHATVFPLVSAPTTMELSTISGEAVPPTMQAMLNNNSVNANTANGAGDEGQPMVDRYGFVYDVRSGMKLLREARARKERLKLGVDGMGDDEVELRKAAAGIDEAMAPLDASDTTGDAASAQTQDEVDAELDALQKALGIAPSTATSPNHSRSPVPRSPVPTNLHSVDEDSPSMTNLASSTSSLPPPAKSSRPVRLVRAPSSDAAPSPPPPGPASMKLLLTQLKDMSDALEKSQKIAWDDFIARRQTQIANARRKGLEMDDDSDGEGEGSRNRSGSTAKKSGSSGGGKREQSRRRKRQRPRTVAVGASVNALLDDVVWGGDHDASEEAEKPWSEDLVGVAQMGVAGKSGKEDWAEFKELVRKGVPIAYRPKIWAECSGANEAREPGVYQDLLAQHKSEENLCLNQIDMDCHRTFPTNVFFAGNGPGVAKLRNILIAYSWRNPKIGYCQGMNNLTATLLLTHPAEEDAFWVLVCIIEKILPSDYYTSHLLVSQADQRVLRDLIAQHMPEIADHLEDLGVELPAITFGWFLSLFTDALPIQTLLRVWDLIFVLGTVVLFRVAVAIIKMNHAEILACDSAASLYALMRAMTTHLYQVDKLLKIACEDLRSVIKDRDISVLRNVHVEALRAEMGLVDSDDEEGEGDRSIEG